jgi:predicted HTH transcriptional regulator
MAIAFPDLDHMTSLLDHKIEEPDVEYKTWMDLSNPENKSKIAKHLCAIANYGGGWLIFGISDDGSYAEPHPGDLSKYSQDIINGIVSRYLQPPIHCSVHFVLSSTNKREYPVVRVPPHGALPICAKADGPLIGKNRIGVTKGIHYIRLPGPPRKRNVGIKRFARTPPSPSLQRRLFRERGML